jgi:transcriptional regulator with XRE-family HTH domain
MRFQPLSDKLCNRLATLIRDRRVQMGFSMNEVATRTGFAVSFIGYVERGERRPSVESLAKIAWALETTATELLGAAERPLFEKGESKKTN